MTYYVTREDGVKTEGLTKEQIYELINGTTGEIPEGVDEAFITKLREINKSDNISLWVGSNAEYNDIEVKDTNTVYIVTNDTFYTDLEDRINSVENRMSAVEQGNVSFENEVTEAFNSFEDVVNERLEYVESMLSIESKYYSFTRTCRHPNYISNATLTLSEDIPIGERQNIYVTVLYRSNIENANGDYHIMYFNSGTITINAKTAGSYKIIKTETVGNAGAPSVVSKEGTTQTQTLVQFGGFNYEDTVELDSRGEAVNASAKSVTVKLEVERLS